MSQRPKTVLVGKDNEAIPILLSIHCEAENPSILDTTYNTGKMWKGLTYNLTRMDIDPRHPVDVVGNFMQMPFSDNSFDVIVFDPPHLPTSAAKGKSSRIFEDKYGITDSGFGREGENVSGMFEPFLVEARRVIKERGILLVKLADLINNHRYQWQQVDFINAVRSVGGLTPCDMLIKCDPCAGNLNSSKWKNIKHLRKAHCYWIVVREGNRCERR